MRRAEVTEYVQDQAPNVFESNYLGVYEKDGQLRAVFVNDNGDLKIIVIDPDGPASRGDFRFV